MYNFRSLFNKFPTIFLSLISYILLLTLGIFSQKKGNLKFSDSKMWSREESVKFSFSSYVKLHQIKILGKIVLKPLYFRKDSSSPRMTEQVQIL